jgi:hypothetical protein
VVDDDRIRASLVQHAFHRGDVGREQHVEALSP